jgi:diacylglycerol kinase (ATP)
MRHTLWQSFQYAGRGLRDAFRSQRTMRIHVFLVCAVILIVAWLRLSTVETALLVLCMAAVLAAELMNTAVEAVVDLQVGENRHALAGRAKDLSAAAVLVMAAGAAVVGLVVLGPPVAAAIGTGGVDGLAVARGGTLLTVLAVLVIAVRRAGERSAGGENSSKGMP